MKQTLLLALFLAATFSAAIASPRRARMAKPESPTTAVQDVAVAEQDTAPPSAGLSDQPEEPAAEANDPEPPKAVEETKPEVDPVEGKVEDHDVVETVVSDLEEEAAPIQPADTASVPHQADTELADEPQLHETQSPSTDEKASKSFLSLFLNGLGHIKSAISDLQTRMETFFISSDAVEALAGVAKH